MIKSRAVLLLMAMVLIVGSVVCSAMSLRGFSRPDSLPLVVNNTDFDLGILRQGTSRKAKFRLTNSVDDAVLINKIMGSCSCTSHTLSQSRIEPGKSSNLELVYSSDSARGKVSSAVSVFYFVEGNPKLWRQEVKIAAQVEPDISRSPNQLVFTLGQPGKDVITLTANRLEQFQVNSVTCTHRAFSASVEKKAGMGKQLQVTVRFDPSLWKNRRQNARLLIDTNSRAEPVQRVSLVVRKPIPTSSGSESIE